MYNIDLFFESPLRITNNLVYYGFSLNTSSLSGDIFWNAFLSGTVEIPGNIAAFLGITYLGRKPTVAGGLTIAGSTSLLCIPFLGSEGVLRQNVHPVIVGNVPTPCSHFSLLHHRDVTDDDWEDGDLRNV